MKKDFKHILWYGSLLSVLIFSLKWMQWKFLITDNAIEIYIGWIAVFFTVLGIWIAMQLIKPKTKTVIVEKAVYLPHQHHTMIDENELIKLNLTNREYEVLKLLVQGLSNAGIAENLFLSLSTIKTHVSNLYLKMEVKNRVQALEKATRLKII